MLNKVKKKSQPPGVGNFNKFALLIKGGLIQEIERKFILDKLPKISELDWLKLKYLSILYCHRYRTNKSRMQVRDRDNVNYTITVKRGYGLLR